MFDCVQQHLKWKWKNAKLIKIYEWQHWQFHPIYIIFGVFWPFSLNLFDFFSLVFSLYIFFGVFFSFHFASRGGRGLLYFYRQVVKDWKLLSWNWGLFSSRFYRSWNIFIGRFDIFMEYFAKTDEELIRPYFEETSTNKLFKNYWEKI